MELPPLQEDEVALRSAMLSAVHAAIDERGGLLPFDRYMDLALYAPGLGYYVNGRRRFGEAGDFVTAPEVSPLFARCVAGQAEQVLAALGSDGGILEVGAGSGVLAAGLLAELETRERLPASYAILDVSPDLRALQRETLAARVPHLLERVHWLDSLPAAGFRGLVLANELLDAMPVHRFRATKTGFEEGVVVARGAADLVLDWRPVAGSDLGVALDHLARKLGGFPPGYVSETNLRLAPWVRALAGGMEQGVVLLFDYGYPRAEYYMAERDRGTLICHFRHRAYSDPFLLPGLQDITANVDFTAVAEAGAAAGFALGGYTTQAHFLLDTGLDRLVAASDPHAVRAHMTLVQGVKKLTMPSEMGERFKALALRKGMDLELAGFATRDLSGRL